MADLSDDEIESIGHRKAWRYKHSPYQGDSTYEFRLHTLVDFARAAIAADRALNAPQAAPVALAERAGWQPIKTAPDDVDVFLWATKRGGRAFVGKWGNYDKYNEPRITHWAPIVPPAAPTPDQTKG